MGFNLPLITFVPNQQARAEDVNSNFMVLNGGNLQRLFSDNGALFSDGRGNLVFGGRLGVNSPGDTLDGADPANTYISCRPDIGSPGTGSIAFQTPNGTTQGIIDASGYTMTSPNTVMNFFQGAIGRVSLFTGTGSGTYTHAMSIAPNWVYPTCTVTNASGGYGFDSTGATSVHITANNSLAFVAYCIR